LDSRLRVHHATNLALAGLRSSRHWTSSTPGPPTSTPRPERLPAGARLVGRAEVVLDGEARASIPLAVETSAGLPFTRTHALEGAWTGAGGRLWFFFGDGVERPHVRSAEEGRWTLVDHLRDERSSFLLLLRLAR
jgi:hypothetical protein